MECSKIVKREKRCFSIHGHALSRTQLCKRRRAKQTDETRCKCQRATRSNESLGLWALLKSAAAVRMRIDIKCCLRVAQFSLSLFSRQHALQLPRGASHSTCKNDRLNCAQPGAKNETSGCVPSVSARGAQPSPPPPPQITRLAIDSELIAPCWETPGCIFDCSSR